MSPRSLPRSFTPTELRSLIAASRPDVAALVIFLSETGLRLAEACSISREEALTWDSRSRFHRTRPAFVEIVGKGSKARLVVVSPEAIRAAGYLLEHPSERARAAFLVPWGRRWTEQLVRDAGEAAGLHAWPHRLRHTFAQDHVDAGTPVDVVADMMGHTSVNTTRIYEAASRARRVEALKRRRRWARRAR